MTSNANTVDSDNDSLMWADKEDDQDADQNNDDQKNNDQAQIAQPQPQVQYAWKWQENDGNWHAYDVASQTLLEQMQIGAKISITAGKWTYDLVKNQPDQCTQTNAQTHASRACRRFQQSSAAAATPPTPAPATPILPPGNGRYMMMWQFLENDDKWKDLGAGIALKLEQLPVKAKLRYAFGQYTYKVRKTSSDQCLQTNEQTNNQRDLRRILYDSDQSVLKRVVWRFKDDKGKWIAVDSNELMLKLQQLPIGQSTRHTREKWSYVISKVDAVTASQRNEQTQKIRQFKVVHMDHDAMDANWSSNASTNNPNYKAAFSQSQSQSQSQPQTFAAAMHMNSQRLRMIRALAQQQNANGNGDDNDAEIIEVDPDDVQEIIIAEDNEDLRQLNRHDCNDDEQQFQAPNQNNSAQSGDDEDDGNKNGNEIQPERVSMSDGDRQILNEFRKTMTSDSVAVLSVRKIKDNVSKTMVYGALLTAKKEELKNVAQIERVLFHGTTAGNVAKIVNSGFNRDFNRHHLYGKGSYFSSLASESAKYCECDGADDTEDADDGKYVMLVCRVIVGEFVQGTQHMDGASVPYKQDKKTQYESCVNNVQHPTIFVVNRDYHAIPTHIITFKYTN